MQNRRIRNEYAELHISASATALQKFYNHAFTMLKIEPGQIVATYYEYPSWNQDNKPNPEPAATDPVITKIPGKPDQETKNPIYTEIIPRIQRKAAGV